MIVDQTVPDFSLPATGDQVFSLAAARGSVLVVYFYPKDATPGCTTEALQFRELHEAFRRAGCRVVGISRDGIPSHHRFKARLDLPFDLLSDADETVCARFGVIRQKVLYGKPVRGIERSTFVIDAGGTLRREWRGVKADGHAAAVMEFVNTLQGMR